MISVWSFVGSGRFTVAIRFIRGVCARTFYASSNDAIHIIAIELHLEVCLICYYESHKIIFFCNYKDHLYNFIHSVLILYEL